MHLRRQGQPVADRGRRARAAGVTVIAATAGRRRSSTGSTSGHSPWLPPGEHVDLPGRGRTFCRILEGPPGAATLLLLHGWTASADLNWFTAYQELGRRFTVIAMDHRGHGRGIRSRRRFRMSDCADDAAALIDELGTGPVIPVGYSMGGPIAQLLWRRHPEAVAGLVLCATTRTFASRFGEKVGFAGLGGLSLASRVVPEVVRRQVAARLVGTPPDDSAGMRSWIVGELRRSDWTAVLEAGRAIGRFDSRTWIGMCDVPTAVVATMSDGMVAPQRQIALARAIPGATVHPVQGNHTVCVEHPDRFLPPLLEACESVARRVRASTGA